MTTNAKSLDQPCDTRMMNIVHAALRRDLARASVVLVDPGRVEPQRLRALGRHLVWLVDFLHGHHEAEDAHLFPAVMAKRPDLEQLIGLMDDEHSAIAPALDQLEKVGARVASGSMAGAEGIAALAEAVLGLDEVLAPHLLDEETKMMPVVEEVLTEAEWQSYDQENLHKSKAELAFIGHWLLDGLHDDQDRRKVTGQVPPLVAWVLINLMGRRYKQHFRATWEQTPAAVIASSPLPRLGGTSERTTDTQHSNE